MLTKGHPWAPVFTSFPVGDRVSWLLAAVWDRPAGLSASRGSPVSTPILPWEHWDRRPVLPCLAWWEVLEIHTQACGKCSTHWTIFSSLPQIFKGKKYIEQYIPFLEYWYSIWRSILRGIKKKPKTKTQTLLLKNHKEFTRNYSLKDWTIWEIILIWRRDFGCFWKNS